MRRILAFLLTLFAHTVVGQVIVGPERQLSFPDLQPAAFDQRDAAAASDGSGWLVAWTSGTYSARAFIAATRIDSSGNVLDPSPIIIASGAVLHSAVAFDGDRYLIAWAASNSIGARLVDGDGALSPAVEIASVNLILPVANVEAAWDGSRFLVAWTEILDGSFSTTRRRAVILDARANVTVSNITLSEGFGSLDFALAGSTGEFAIFDSVPDFSGTPTGNGVPSSVRAFRVDDSGQKAAPIQIDRAITPVFSPRAAFNGAEYLVVWSTNAELPGQARGARLSVDGTVTSIAPFYSGGDTVNTLTWTGSEYIVTLSDQQHVDAVRLSSSGAASSPLKLAFVTTRSGNTSASGAVWNGRELLVTIETAADVYEKFLDRTAELVDPSLADRRSELIDPNQKGLPVALSPSHQEAPAIASAGFGDSLVVWTETLTASEKKFAMAMSLHDGLPLADYPIVLEPAEVPLGVASDGTQYLGVWARTLGGLAGQRIDRGGKPIDLQPFVIAPSVSGLPVVNYDGENFVMAYGSGGGCRYLPPPNLFVSRVSPAGTVLEPRIVAINGRSCGTDMSLASGTNGSLFAWDDVDGLLSVEFITRDGVPAGRMNLSPTFSGYLIRAAWTGTQFIVADVVPPGPANAGGVQWLTLNENGTPLLHGFAPQQSPALEIVSSSFTRLGNGALFVWSGGHAGDHDIFGLRLSADGTAIGKPFVISATEFDETNVAVAEDVNGRAEVVYQRTIDFPGVSGLTRIFTRQVEITPSPLRRRATR